MRISISANCCILLQLEMAFSAWRMIRSCAHNLYRRLPDNMEVAHRKIAAKTVVAQTSSGSQSRPLLSASLVNTDPGLRQPPSYTQSLLQRLQQT